MKRRIKWIVLAALTVIIGAVVVTMAIRGGGAGPEVETTPVQRETIASVVSASGDLAARARREVSPQVSSTVAELPVKDGQKVVAGQLLARLDAAPLRVAAVQAESAYQQARAQRTELLKAIPGGCELKAAQAQVDQTYFAYKLARTRWRRAGLYQKNDAKLAMDQAYAAYLAAKANLQKLQTASRVGAQLRAADSAAAAAAKAWNKAVADVNKTEVFAPTAGTLIFKAQTNPVTGEQSTLTEGAAVTAGSPVFTIANLGYTEFVADVDETDVSKVRTGQKATVTLDAFPDKVFNGRVAKIAAAAVTAKSGGTSFPVTVKLPRNRLALRIGMNGSADIVRAQARDVLVVPFEAVVERAGARYVFVVERDVVRQREIATGLATDTYYEVTTGLSEGDKVVRTKAASLKDGQQVTVK